MFLWLMPSWGRTWIDGEVCDMGCVQFPWGEVEEFVNGGGLFNPNP